MNKKTIGPFPKHWPYVSPEQQFEGFKASIENSKMTVWEFERSMRILVRARIMSKSRMHKLIKWFRHIKGISYQEYMSKRDTRPFSNEMSIGLWW